MSTSCRLVLVVPVYNFEAGIEETLQRLAHWHTTQGQSSIHIVLVDDASTDRTADLIAAFITKHQRDWQLLRSDANQGKGYTVRRGIQAAYALYPEFIVFTDCDLYYGLDIIFARMLPLLEQSDIVIIDRSLGQQDLDVPLRRRLASAVFNRLVALLTGIHYKDTQAGLKGFKAASCKPLFDVLTLNRFAFDVELLSVALHHQFRIEQLPVESLHRIMEYVSTVSMLPSSLQMLRDLIRINWNWKAGRYTSPTLQRRVEEKMYAITDD